MTRTTALWLVLALAGCSDRDATPGQTIGIGEGPRADVEDAGASSDASSSEDAGIDEDVGPDGDGAADAPDGGEDAFQEDAQPPCAWPDCDCSELLEGAECDDDDACTEGDGCAAGKCAGQPIDCEDGELCTDVGCDPATGCTYTPNSEPCDDGDACTLDDACADGECKSGAVASCEDGNPCTPETVCEPDIGCPTVDEVDCDDGNPCTTDACDGGGGCLYAAVTNAECRPTITVESPARGATLTGAPAVTVTGTVTTGAGEILFLTLNQETVEVGADGAFEHTVNPTIGGNTLVFETADSYGRERRRVQAFNWSFEYLTADDKANPGMGLWLDDTAIDDGDHDHDDPDDVATLFEILMATFDIAGLIPSPAMKDLKPLGENATLTYDVYIDSLTYAPPKVAVVPIDGGLHLTATIVDAEGEITAQRTAGFLAPQVITGTLYMESITIDADIFVSVDTGTNEVSSELQNTTVAIEGVSVDVDGLLLSLLEGLITSFVNDFIEDIEAQFVTAIEDAVQPLLEDVLAALAFTASFEIDPIDPTAAPIQVTLATDFAAAQFTPAGGAFVLRVGVTGSEKVVEYEPLGAARRHGCGAGTPPMSLPGESKIEVAVHDDTLSLLLLSLWEGGLLDFEVPPELLGSEAIGMLPLEDLVVTLSGMLPPALSDCNVDAQLVVHIGDLRADATLEFAGQPMTVEMYASFEAPLTLDAADGVLQMSLGEITAVELEVTVLEAEAIPFESVIATLIEENLVPTLLNTLSGGALGGIPLPSIDLSGVGGLPEGTALEIQAEGSIRQPGVTVIQGTL